MSIEQYINLRKRGKRNWGDSKQSLLSEATLLTLELGYKCYEKTFRWIKQLILSIKL